VQDADTAMEQRKRKGGAGHQIIDLREANRASDWNSLEHDLHQAVADNRLELHYQPIVELRTGRVIGFESLIRWNHPERGLLPPGDFIPLAEESGLRVYYAPQCTAAENYFDDQGRLQPLWNEAAGFDQLERAARYVEDNHGKFDGRLQGLILVRNFILATVPLMRRAKEYADRLGVPCSTHFCEQLFEFHETVRKHGVTPVDLMEAEGLLGPNVILAHCVYISGHSATTWQYSSDLEKLGQTKTVVSHAPVAYMRRGYNLEGFERYLDHDVTMSMGTDVMPHDIIAEMRLGALSAKFIGKSHEAGTSAAFFDAATLGGAKAFNRDDIGRLAAGAKADIVIMDFDNMQIGPVYDPIRSLVQLATPDLIETVICDGKSLMTDGALTGYDERAVIEGGNRSFQQVVDQFQERHWSHKPIEQIFPASYPAW